jgi:hypothetical protein
VYQRRVRNECSEASPAMNGNIIFSSNNKKFQVFTAVEIEAVVSWHVTPFSDMVKYQWFEGPRYLHQDVP